MKWQFPRSLRPWLLFQGHTRLLFGGLGGTRLADPEQENAFPGEGSASSGRLPAMSSFYWNPKLLWDTIYVVFRPHSCRRVILKCFWSASKSLYPEQGVEQEVKGGAMGRGHGNTSPIASVGIAGSQIALPSEQKPPWYIFIAVTGFTSVDQSEDMEGHGLSAS